MLHPLGRDARYQVEVAFGLDMDDLLPGQYIDTEMYLLDALFSLGRSHAHALARCKAFAGEHGCIFFSGEANYEPPRFERLNADRSLAA